VSQATVCDGCHELCAQTQKRGRQRALDYCEACAGLVDSRQQQIDALHAEVAALFTERLEAIDEEFQAQCPKMKFPL